MASQLTIYNRALQMAGERELSTLSDAVESRRLLDNVWDNGCIDACLSEAQWLFAMRTQQIDYDPSIEPPFGYQRALNKPSDLILLSALCSDGHLRSPITMYQDDVDNWYCDYDTIYVRFVSNDTDYGGNLGNWPATFAEFVAGHLAGNIILKLTGDMNKMEAFLNPANPEHSLWGRLLLQAKSRNAMGNPSQMMAAGSWVKSRMSGGYQRDGGSLTNLTG